jgi:hypothetical protein
VVVVETIAMYRLRPHRSIGRIINTRRGIGGLAGAGAFDLQYAEPVIGGDAQVASVMAQQQESYIAGSQPEQVAHGMLAYEDQSTQVRSPPTQYLAPNGQVYTSPGGATETTGAYDAPANGVPTLSRDAVGDYQALQQASQQVYEAQHGSLEPAVAEPAAGGPLIEDVSNGRVIPAEAASFWAKPLGFTWGQVGLGLVVVAGVGFALTLAFRRR